MAEFSYMVTLNQKVNSPPTVFQDSTMGSCYPCQHELHAAQFWTKV